MVAPAITMKDWFQIAWPVGLLLLFGAAFSREPGGRGRVDVVAECDLSATVDVGVLERCLQFQSNDVELLVALGDAYESAGRLADAERAYRRAAASDPRDGHVHLRLGQVLLQRGDIDAARGEGDTALALQPGNPAALRLIERAAPGDGVRQ